MRQKEWGSCINSKELLQQCFNSIIAKFTKGGELRRKTYRFEFLSVEYFDV